MGLTSREIVALILALLFLQVLYLVSDPKSPAPAELLAHTAREQEFMAQYLKRNGIQWRHYFGPNGPRPPPSLFMWPASHIGQVHTVTSTEGYWYVEDELICV